MKIVDGLTKHTVCVCVDKAERGIPIQTVLTKLGFKVVLANGLYDLLKSISQEMPHLIITESILQEGNAGTLYDKIKQDPILNKTPILVLVLKKTKEEIQPLQGRKFAGFLLGPMEPTSLTAKIKEILSTSVMVSPYFVSAEELGIESKFSISLEANAIGKTEDNVAFRSKSFIDNAASIVCVPQDKRKSPVILKMATNLEANGEYVNLFPLSRMQGKGRDWVTELPAFDANGGGGAAGKKKGSRKVIFFDPNATRFQQFKEVLAGYDIDLAHANSLAMAGALVARDFEAIGSVYLNELPNDSSSMGWKTAYEKIPAKSRPPVIVGTTSMAAKSTAQLRYLKKPFGLGVLVETFEASFERSDNILPSGSDGAPAAAPTGTIVNYQAPATLLGLDETGGVFQIKFPIIAGSKMNLTHPVLEKLWGGQAQVIISAASAVPETPEIWQVRFESVPAGTSKSKYWEKIAKDLAAMRPAPVPQPAAGVEPTLETAKGAA